MDHPAVKLWRDRFKLNLSSSWKHDVEVTVTDLSLWKKILDGWGYWKDGKWHRKAPGIKGLLDEYERLEADKRDNEAGVIRTRGHEGVSPRSEGNVSKVRSEPPSLYFRVG